MNFILRAIVLLSGVAMLGVAVRTHYNLPIFPQSETIQLNADGMPVN